MKWVVFLASLLLTVLAIFLLAKKFTSPTIRITKKLAQTVSQKKGAMKITSPRFENNANIPLDYTCDGKNVNPPLLFSSVPQNVKSLALIVDDPDAPSKTWVHWVVYNINPTVQDVSENSIPKGGIESTTDFSKPGYGGPCPPSGTHRYFFKLYALDTMLDLPNGATKDQVEEAMKNHIIDSAELIGLYKRG